MLHYNYSQISMVVVDCMLFMWRDLSNRHEDTGRSTHSKMTDVMLCTLRWRHNERGGVSNHQPYDCLLNCLFANQRKHQIFALLVFVRGIHRSPVNSQHKGPVTRKMFPFDDVIMKVDSLAHCCCLPHQSAGTPLLTWINFNPTWIGNYIHYTVWDEITYPFPNFNGAAVEVWEWKSYFIRHFTRHVIPYPCWNKS